ncbi:UDP-2,3-diacylglucosamine diphosphatase LpxI [Octadecabacter sp.]|nr:UDP-2,3-diacylglucosamine diphosphatase LpxI [Octadecabacter sp.]
MSVALIAGGGALPPHLAGSLMAQGRAPVICELRDHPSEVDGRFERVRFRLETLGTFLETLSALGVREICMAGSVRRHQIHPAYIDDATVPLVPRLKSAMARGDDGALREIVAIIREHGFTVVGAHDVDPGLLPHAGVHTTVAPPDLTDDLIAARSALAQMGRADMGQAMLIRAGKVIAREDRHGTAAMLEATHTPLTDQAAPKSRIQSLALLSAVVAALIAAIAAAIAWGGSFHSSDIKKKVQADGGFLFKAPKPDQMRVVDMPTIGPDTARQAADAGLAGIVIQSNGVIVLDLPQVVAILDARKMFLWVTP